MDTMDDVFGTLPPEKKPDFETRFQAAIVKHIHLAPVLALGGAIVGGTVQRASTYRAAEEAYREAHSPMLKTQLAELDAQIPNVIKVIASLEQVKEKGLNEADVNQIMSAYFLSIGKRLHNDLSAEQQALAEQMAAGEAARSPVAVQKNVDADLVQLMARVHVQEIFNIANQKARLVVEHEKAVKEAGTAGERVMPGLLQGAITAVAGYGVIIELLAAYHHLREQKKSSAAAR